RWQWSSGGGGGNGVYRTKINGADESVSSAVFRVLQGATDGNYEISIEERDDAGNYSEPARLTIRVNKTSPNPPVFDGSQQEIYTVARPVFRWNSGGGGIGRYEVELVGHLTTLVDATTYAPP